MKLIFTYSLTKSRDVLIESIRLGEPNSPPFIFKTEDKPLQCHPVLRSKLPDYGSRLGDIGKANSGTLCVELDPTQLKTYLSESGSFFFRYDLLKIDESAVYRYDPTISPDHHLNKFNQKFKHFAAIKKKDKFIELMPQSEKLFWKSKSLGLSWKGLADNFLHHYRPIFDRYSSDSLKAGFDQTKEPLFEFLRTKFQLFKYLQIDLSAGLKIARSCLGQNKELIRLYDHWTTDTTTEEDVLRKAKLWHDQRTAVIGVDAIDEEQQAEQSNRELERNDLPSNLPMTDLPMKDLSEPSPPAINHPVANVLDEICLEKISQITGKHSRFIKNTVYQLDKHYVPLVHHAATVKIRQTKSKEKITIADLKKALNPKIKPIASSGDYFKKIKAGKNANANLAIENPPPAPPTAQPKSKRGRPRKAQFYETGRFFVLFFCFLSVPLHLLTLLSFSGSPTADRPPINWHDAASQPVTFVTESVKQLLDKGQNKDQNEVDEIEKDGPNQDLVGRLDDSMLARWNEEMEAIANDAAGENFEEEEDEREFEMMEGDD